MCTDERRSISRSTISPPEVALRVPVAAAEAAAHRAVAVAEVAQVLVHPAVVAVQLQLRERVPAAEVVQVLPALQPEALLLLLSQRLQRPVIRRQLRLVAVVDRPLDEAAQVVVAAVQEVVQAPVARLWPVIRFVRVLQFPVWKLSMPYLRRALIRMWH